MSLLIVVEALDLGDVFVVFFDGVDVSIYYKRVVATTTPLSLTPKSFLILVFLARLALVGRKLLVLATRCVNGKIISRFSSSRIFLLFFYEFVFLGAP